MIQIQKSTDLRNLLIDIYNDEPEFHATRYKKIGEGENGYVNQTLALFVLKKVKVNELYIEDKRIGYFGDHEGNLTGFFLKKEYRTPEYKNDFINTIKSYFGKEFNVCLPKSNERAIKFLNKMGFNKIQEDNELVLFRS